MNIAITTQERTAETLSSAHLDHAVAAIRNDGYAVLEDIVSHDHLDQLREQMDKDAQLLYDAKQWSGAGGLPGHLLLGPPPFAPFVFRDIVQNAWSHNPLVSVDPASGEIFIAHIGCGKLPAGALAWRARYRAALAEAGGCVALLERYAAALPALAPIAWREGTVHGDLNGANILVDTEEVVWPVGFLQSRVSD